MQRLNLLQDEQEMLSHEVWTWGLTWIEDKSPPTNQTEEFSYSFLLKFLRFYIYDLPYTGYPPTIQFLLLLWRTYRQDIPGSVKVQNSLADRWSRKADFTQRVIGKQLKFGASLDDKDIAFLAGIVNSTI